jgi:hypothetical protein
MTENGRGSSDDPQNAPQRDSEGRDSGTEGPNPFSREAAERPEAPEEQAPGQPAASSSTSSPSSAWRAEQGEGAADPYGAQDQGYPTPGSQGSAPYSPQGSGPYNPQGSGPYSPQSSGPYNPQSSGGAGEPPASGPAWPGYPTQSSAGEPGRYGSGADPYGGYPGGPGQYPYGNAQSQPDQGYPQQPLPYGDGQDTSASGYGGGPYETNPYQAAPYHPGVSGYAPYGTPVETHPQAVVALILGIVGLVACPIVGPGAVYLGHKARKEIDAEPHRYTGRGMATTGFVLGIVGTLFLVVSVVLLTVLGIASSSY